MLDETKDIEFQEAIDIMTSTLVRLDHKLTSLENVIEQMQQQIAVLSVGFGEQSVMIDGLINQLRFESEERQEQFKKDIVSARDEMFKVMRNGIGDLVEQSSRNTAAAMENVAEGESSSTSEE